MDLIKIIHTNKPINKKYFILTPNISLPKFWVEICWEDLCFLKTHSKNILMKINIYYFYNFGYGIFIFEIVD